LAGNTTEPGRTVTSRALSILGAFDAEHPKLSLSRLSARAGLSLATCHRLVAELAAWGALARLSDGEYVIGHRIWRQGLLAPINSRLREAASPFLGDLYGATLATSHIAVRDQTFALYLDCVSGHSSVRVLHTSGSRLPLHTTAVGKVLLAYAPPAVQAAVLRHLTRITRYTIVQPGRLMEQLKEVRTNSYASTCEEMVLGSYSLAVPVLVEGGVVAAIGVVVADVNRFRQRDRLLAELRKQALGIGRDVELRSLASARAV